MPFMRLVRRLAALLTVPLLAGGLVACSHQPSPDPAVSAFLDGWRTGRFPSSLPLISADGAGLNGADVASKIKALSGDLATVKPTLKAGKAKVTKNDAAAPVDVSWPIAAGVSWNYRTTLRLTFADTRWKPIWEPAVFAADVTDGDKLAVKTTDAPRGPILDGSGQPMVSDQKVVDVVGYGGLEERYDDRLRGKAGVIVSVAQKPGGSDAAKILFHTDATAGQPLKTTIDTKTQQAAEQALAGVTKPASIVAIRVSDGAIVADANGPGAAALNLGFTAQVPPGSTFKSVTATHVLETGQADANTPIECTQTYNVGGRNFSNVEGEHLGTFPLHQDLAQSCNTAFARLYDKLGATGLHDTATQLGIGVPWDLGIDAFTGKVSVNENDVEQAAAAFGQGTTLVSPVAMA